MRDGAVEKLFSLFTSSDHAVAMAGDLVEERERRGSIWFWLHVVRITFALWRNAATEAPLRVLGLTLAGCALLAAPAFAGVASVYLFPEMFGSLVSWISLSIIWWGGALWTGASLVAMAPRRGMAACAFLAVVGAALLLGFGVTLDPQEFNRVDLMFFTVGIGTAVALLAGGAIGRSQLQSRRLVADDAELGSLGAVVGRAATNQEKGTHMKAQRKPLGAILLAGALIAAALAGIVAFWAAWPRTSNTSPLVALLALVWSCACIGTAVLTWRRSRFAGPAFIAAIGLLLFPARFIVPGGQIFLPSFVVIILVAFLSYRYFRRLSQAAA